MLNVIDTATPQRNLNWGTAFAEGWTRVYVKMGGWNVSPIYVAPYYVQQIDSAWAVGMKHIGHYWVPNGRQDPVYQANWMCDRLHRWDPARCFIVLDNETLDDGLKFTDAQAAAFIQRVTERLGIRGSQVLTYSGLNDARTTQWPQTLATGTNFIIAAYSYPPMQLPAIPTVPVNRIVGHQYGGKAIGGVITDTNLFTDNAFDFGGSVAAYNPFAGVRITGTWADHASYSAGGTDLPLPYSTPIPAPASGILRTSGGSGEWAAGWVGSAGRRSILSLDQPLARHTPRQSSPPEGDGPMTAIVFQHQSRFGPEGHYDITKILGWSGASANGQDYGGDVHLHWHGLNAQGQRVRIESYLPTGTAGGGGTTPIPNLEDDMPIMILAVDDRKGRPWRILGNGYDRIVPDTHVDVMKGAVSKVLEVNAAQYDIICANYLQGESFKVNPAYVRGLDQAAIEKVITDSINAALKDATVSSTITDKDKDAIASLTVEKFIAGVGFAATE